MVQRKLKADPRHQAVIEAEKDETIVTNTGLDAIVEHFVIGGQKHSKGGTPLDVPPGSFVFSDKRSMSIKSEDMLKFFGETGKKAKTPAEIAKKYDLNELKDKLKDPYLDKIEKESLQKTFENRLSKLSALAIVQESLKGTPNGHSPMFDSFMNRTGIDSKALLGLAPQEGGDSYLEQAVKMAVGGPILPKFAGDDKSSTVSKAPTNGTVGPLNTDTPPYEEWKGYTEEGVKQLNQYRIIYNLGPISEKATKSEIQSAIGELQKQAVIRNPALVYDYMTTNPDGSHQPNNKLEDILASKGYDRSKEGLTKAIADGKLSQDEVLNGFNDDKWWYRMVTGEKQYMDKTAYDKFQAENPNGIKQGDYTYFMDPKNPGNYIAYYTDEKGNLKPAPVDPKKPDEPITVSADHLGLAQQEAQNMDFYFQDKNNLRNIQRKKARLRKYADFSPNPELAFTDQAYYSPEQAIHAIASQLQTGMAGINTFTSPQSNASNFASMQGQAFSQVASEISRYADMNVNAYNNERNLNTEIANKKALIGAENARSSYNNRVNLDKAWTRDVNLLDDMLTAGINNAVSNRASRINLENSVGDHYKIDPNTGIAYFDKGDPLKPTAPDKDLASEINDLVTKVPGLQPSDAVKILMANKSGKYALSNDTGFPTADQLSMPN